MASGLIDFIRNRNSARDQLEQDKAREARAQEAREGGALALIRSNPGLSAAFSGEGASTPAAQGLLGALSSSDPTAQGLGQQAAEQVAGRTGSIIEQAQARQKATAERIDRQRGSLQFGQETAQRQVDLARSEIDLARAGFDFEQERIAAAAPKLLDATTGLQFNSMKGAIDSIDTMIQIREDLGAVGPIDYLNHPEAAAQVKNFQSFESVNLFKELANDTRLSDEDRDFYGSIVQLTVADQLFTGGRVEKAQLKMLQRRLEQTQQTLLRLNPGAQQQLPHLFTRKSFDDIGVPFQSPDPPTANRPPLGSFFGVQGAF